MTNMDTDSPVGTSSANDGSASSPSSSVKIVSDATSASGLIITLHPLVIMNISDHHTRTKMQQRSTNPHIFGVLLGVQTGREIEIFNSFEIPHIVIEGQVVIDKTYLISKSEQFRQVFPTYDMVGWYSTGAKPTSSDIHVHKQFLEHNESPLFLQLNPSGAVTSRELPISMYESIIDIVDGEPQMMFIKTQYKIETGEAERIAVDHVAHAANTDAAQGSSLIAHLVSQRNAIKMLNARVNLLHQYVMDVESGVVPKDHNILRQIASLCNRLPTLNSPEFTQEFLVDYNDVLLTTYLATITKGTHGINELVDKFNMTADRRGRARGSMHS
ncbi:hypothetical protein HK102_002802 [Quaeritorhiza haematococci]|nr:hypothetical protein HK102_002802 [Quaeritorhiza haematococci]